VHLLVFGYGLTDRVVQSFRDTDLMRFASLALDQIERSMAFSGGAPAVGLATLAGPFGQRSPQIPPGGGDLRDTRAKAAFGSGNFSATQAFHVLYLLYIRYQRNASAKTQCEFAPSAHTHQNANENSHSDYLKILVTESLGIPGIEEASESLLSESAAANPLH